MKKLFNSPNKNNELWINWLTRKLNSYEAFEEFELGKNPEDIAINKEIQLNNNNQVFEDMKLAYTKLYNEMKDVDRRANDSIVRCP